MEAFKMKTKILELLEQNSRYSAADIALMLGLEEQEVVDSIKEMEKDKIICGYKTLINWDKVEHREVVTALIEVKVTPQRGEGFDKIAERIYRFSEVKAVYLMSGGFDLTVIIEGKTMKEVALFVGQKLAPLDAVLSTGTHFVLNKYKDHGVIFEEIKKDERMIVSP
jgi:DNA-binding Lrp family transcriptional regulator